MTVKKKTVTSVIQEVIVVKNYFSVDAVKKSANKIQRDIYPATINQYLYNMKKLVTSMMWAEDGIPPLLKLFRSQ